MREAFSSASVSGSKPLFSCPAFRGQAGDPQPPSSRRSVRGHTEPGGSAWMYMTMRVPAGRGPNREAPRTAGPPPLARDPALQHITRARAPEFFLLKKVPLLSSLKSSLEMDLARSRTK